MIEENQLITFTTSVLPGKSWLIFAPHADDESIGMGGTIIDAIARGVDVTLVIITNGAIGKSATQDRAEIISIREQEVKKVVKFMGINSVIFLAEEDRGLSLNAQTIDKIAKQLNQVNADTLFIPSAFELHPDHRMTSELVWQAIKQVGFKGETFSYDISIQSPVSHLVDISLSHEKKRQAIALYPSQVAQNNYIDMALAMNKARTFTLPAEVNYAEAFKQLFPHQFETFHDSTFESLRPYLENSKIIKIEQLNAALNEQINEIRQSTSWKITKPLRFLKEMFC